MFLSPIVDDLCFYRLSLGHVHQPSTGTCQCPASFPRGGCYPARPLKYGVGWLSKVRLGMRSMLPAPELYEDERRNDLAQKEGRVG